ncbi:IclR family transcriptional regulator [Arthrobacter sp. NPDC058127]|uniref:IclR family transcriptional regulator n=1 Tax=Arthrobacter sp. NPDC058127 TaxID=3346351 RepID=UPI0036E9B216
MTRHTRHEPSRAGMTSLNQGLRILSHVQETGPIRVALLGEQLGLPLSTLYRYVAPLVEGGFLIRAEGIVIPGEKLLNKQESSHHLVDFAAPLLRRLNRETGLSALLTVRIHTVGVCLDAAIAHPRHRISLQRGQVHPLYAGASVTPLLAFAPADVVESVMQGPYKRFTSATPVPETTRRELPLIRRNRYSLSFGELTPGMGAVGIPVMVSGKCLCALSLVGEAVTVTDTEHLLESLRTAGEELAASLARAGADNAWTSEGEEYV